MTIPCRPVALSLMALLFSGTFFARAQAGGGHFYPPVADPVVREECGSCHLAYSPSMLPEASWQKMMGELSKHFGDDASVDAASAVRITRYLRDNAADRGGQRYGGKLMRGVLINEAPLRITELPKWLSEHRKIASSEWKRKDVLSKANCPACHTDAQRGYYDD